MFRREKIVHFFIALPTARFFVMMAALALASIYSNAQVEDRKPVATPTAASINKFGDVPVDMFTGTPSISIPLYTYKSRDLTVPISLSYHSSNIKPSSIPGWVGFGWSLQAGGVITRRQNDLPDELIDLVNSPGVQRGFFYNYGILSGFNWTSSGNPSTPMGAASAGYENQILAANTSVAHSRPDYAADEFQFNFLGMSGTLMMGQDGLWHLKSRQGLNFSVTPEIGLFAVQEPNLNTSSSGVNTPSLIRNCLTGFILTAADGTTYYFGTAPAAPVSNYSTIPPNGYFTTTDCNAVEFSRVGPGYATSVDWTNRDGGTVAVSWYLTKIVSPTNDVISFKYTRDGPQIIASTVAYGTYQECSACFPPISLDYGAGDNMNLQDGCTLSSISGANGSVQFGKSVANVLDYHQLGSSTSPQQHAWADGDNNGLYFTYANEIFQGYSSSAGPPVHSTFMELDNLNILDNFNNVVKGYAFNYSKSTTTRLVLSSVTETGADGTTLPPYSFLYNNMSGLNTVPYNTVQVDHWGYYNAKDPFTGVFGTNMEPTTLNPFNSTGASYFGNLQVQSNFFDNTFNAGYTANRTPVDGPLEYGILQQITYPTGGNTQFVWEPNYYSKYINTTLSGTTLTPAIADLGANTIGPGVRIQKIVSQANFNSPTVTKTYTYYRDYVNNNLTSSGVLNSPQPSYCDNYSATNYLYREWSSENVVAPHYSDGSPITYTNVQEMNTDGSFKNYTFSNQDNGFLDLPGDNYTWSQFTSNVSPVLQRLALNSLELDRGLVLQESTYKTGSIPLYKKFNVYNNDPNRLNSAVRRYFYAKKLSLAGTVLKVDNGGGWISASGPPIYFGDITAALSIFCYYPFLQKDSVLQYDQNGGNPMAIVTNYTYDGYRNKKTETYQSSKNEQVVKSTNYATDAISGLSTSAQQAQTAMVNAKMVGIPLEHTETRSGNQTDHSRVDYQSYQAGFGILVPANSWKSAYGAGLLSQSSYTNFDDMGNPVQYTTRDGLNTCYDWGYNQSYATVKIINASNTAHNWTTVTNATNSGNYVWLPANFTAQTFNFTVTAAGDIVLNGGFSSDPTGKTYKFNYVLTGPVSQTSSFTICGSGVTCSGTQPPVHIAAIPGNYSLQVTPQSDYTIGASIVYTYPIVVNTPGSAGSKNYFYDGFEENSNIAVTSGMAHTGYFYWNGGSYTPAFTTPDNNSYTIEWWSLQGGNWVFKTQSYSSGMSLSGPVDDVRIFPAGAMMSTYTYCPLVGMTSEIDPRANTTYFAYDAFGRLATQSNKDGNIVKQLCYDYAGQAQTCPIYTPPPLQSVNSTNSTTEDCTLTFVNTANNNSYTFTLPVGAQSSFKVPQAVYNVLIGPVAPTSSYPIIYAYNGIQQTYYGTVEYGGVTVNGPVTVTITH